MNEINESLYTAATWDEASDILTRETARMTADGWTVTNQHIGPANPPLTDWLMGHHQFIASLHCERDPTK